MKVIGESPEPESGSDRLKEKGRSNRAETLRCFYRRTLIEIESSNWTEYSENGVMVDRVVF